MNMQGPLTFVLGEDNPDHVELALMAVEDIHPDNKVLVGSNGEEVLAHLESSPKLPDAILLDIKMPLMNGIEVLEAMALRPEWAGIPVIVVSTSANPRDIERCKSLGVKSFVTKPYSNEEIEQALQAV